MWRGGNSEQTFLNQNSDALFLEQFHRTRPPIALD
jgi:hypothetical protein